MNYKEYKNKKLEEKIRDAKEEDKAFAKINGVLTFVAWLIRWHKVEGLIGVVLILATVVVLQWLGFNFAFWK